MGEKLNYKEAFFKLLNEEAVSIAGGCGEEKKEEVKELFELLEQLEDQEEAKNWVAQIINDLNIDNEPFLKEGIRFIRPQAFKEADATEKTESSSPGTGGAG